MINHQRLNMDEATLYELKQNPDYQILKRVKTTLQPKNSSDSKRFIATIIDLETMGFNAKTDEIIEIGLLSFAFTSQDGIIEVINEYNQLNDPGRPIPNEITKVTGIRDEDVLGKAIDWNIVLPLLQQSNLIICHNSGFDRNFLELQTPNTIQSVIKSMPFGCTLKDINWKNQGIESSKLDYINWKLGFFYDGHRAINDCWATLNVLLHADGVFDELKTNVRKKETLICAKDAPYDKKDLLKARHYRWSDGHGNLPKGWCTCIPSDLLEDEQIWLDENVFGIQGASQRLPQTEITARTRYSYRAETLF